MYSKMEKVIMWLTTFDFMSYKKARFIIDSFDNLEEFFDNINVYIPVLKQTFETSEVENLIREANLNYINKVITNYNELGIQVVTIKSEGYPNSLMEIDSSPILLYCKGDISLLKTDGLAVVGTRRATKYGKDMCAKYIKDIASNNVVIISGLADGIDSVAHKTCLEAGGKTIAVLGGGLLNIYPSSNIKLADEIVEKGGLLVTEYKPSEQALTFHFPIRNRIIAALSKAVFVVEATEKSGSMYTKNYAIDYNKEVFALSGRAGDIYSIGCNKCIQNGQARMVLSSSEIMDYFGKSIFQNDTRDRIQLTCEEQLIYNALLGHEKHFDELIKETGLDAKVLQTLLMRMVLSDVVDKQPNNYYSLV